MEEIFYGSTHNHTDYSNFRLRDCIIKLKDLCEYTAEIGHKFVTITDHETIASSIACQEIEQEIRKKYPYFKVIRGNEIYLCRNGLNSENFVRGQDKYWHFILIAKDEIGHKQLRELSTKAWLRSYKTGKMIRVPTYYSDLEEIVKSNQGHLIAQSSCLGSFLDYLEIDYMNNPTPEKWEKIIQWVKYIQDIFGKENFFLEVQPAITKEQVMVYKAMNKLSKELDIPVQISLDAHYLKKEDKGIHKAFVTSQDGERETDDFYATTYVMTIDEIKEYMLQNVPEKIVNKWLNNSKLVYDACVDYDLTKPLRIPYLPLTIDKVTSEEYEEFKDKIKELPYFYNSQHQADRDMASALIKKIISDRLQYDNKETFEEMDKNLEAIRISSDKQNTRWSAYLLNMRDYVKVIWEKGNSLVGCSRGSGGGFLLLNMLDIIQVNPMREKAPLKYWRFLNPERASVLDVDTDIEGGKRPQVYKAFQDTYGEDRVSKVLTIRTEKTKSCILTAMRGLGYSPEEASYVSSFIKSDRGQQRTLHQTYYGDEENNMQPDQSFRDLMNNKYPDVWKVAKSIEGLCCGVGSHAGGIIFYDEPITNSTALMKTTNGDVVTQYELHTAEKVGLIKIDLLSIEALDKMRACLDLLIKYGYINAEGKTLKQVYEDTIGIYNIDRNNKKAWEFLNDHKIISLFQMEKQSGIKGITTVHPQSVEDLATLNAVIRLMGENGKEQPIDKFARFKTNINEWYKEMNEKGLTKEEQKLLYNIVGGSYGICESQEKFMMLVQLKECGGFSLLWSDKLRKSIAKKNPKAFNELEKEFFKVNKEQNNSENFYTYVWELVSLSKGYGFE